MNGLQNQLKYEAKQKELRGLVELEARRLQGVQEAVANSEREVRENITRKATLTKTIAKMELELIEKRKEKKEFSKEKAELDIFKEHITELLNKLTAYKQAIEGTVNYANEMLKTNSIPMTFGLPPNETIEITFNNFNKYE